MSKCPIKNRNYTNREWLRHQYIDLPNSSTTIAIKCGVHPSTISRWLNKFGIYEEASQVRREGKIRKRKEIECKNCETIFNEDLEICENCGELMK